MTKNCVVPKIPRSFPSLKLDLFGLTQYSTFDVLGDVIDSWEEKEE